jgi:hypothetical protein
MGSSKAPANAMIARRPPATPRTNPNPDRREAGTVSRARTPLRRVCSPRRPDQRAAQSVRLEAERRIAVQVDAEGFSLDDSPAARAHIAERGRGRRRRRWEGDERHAPWAYTVGLLGRADHPELIIAGVADSRAPSCRASHGWCRRRQQFEVGDEIDIEKRHPAVRRSQRHPVRALDTFNWWHNPSGSAQFTPYAPAARSVAATFCLLRRARLRTALLGNPAARVGGQADARG